MTESSQGTFVARRGELMAELFLQDLHPRVVARPMIDYGYDFLVSFENDQGGINTVGVVVKATEQSVPPQYPLARNVFNRLVHSNVPGLLLVVNVKQNKIYYWWPKHIDGPERSAARSVSIPVTEADERIKKDLRKRLAA